MIKGVELVRKSVNITTAFQSVIRVHDGAGWAAGAAKTVSSAR